jgi:hypothetical protein
MRQAMCLITHCIWQQEHFGMSVKHDNMLKVISGKFTVATKLGGACSPMLGAGRM